MASIARAFTMRRKRVDSGVDVPHAHEDMPSPPSPSRSRSMRFSKKSVDIKKISAPVQLLSTTNMLTYDAPDVAVIQAQRKASSSVSSGSSAASVDDDASSTSSRFRDTQMTDTSSVGSVSPVASPGEKKMTFFESTSASKGASSLRRSISSAEMRHQSIQEEQPSDLPPRSESPAIPQRHPSHSKRAHTELARKRSMQIMSTSSMSRAHSIAGTLASRKESSNTSLDYFNGESIPSITTTPAATPPTHPFGKELEQLDEVAEEFTVVANDVERVNDIKVMRQCGLAHFCAADYLSEIQPLFASYVHTHLSAPQPMAWI